MMALTLPEMRRRMKTLLLYLLLGAVGQVIEIRRKRDPRIIRLQETMAPQSLMD